MSMWGTEATPGQTGISLEGGRLRSQKCILTLEAIDSIDFQSQACEFSVPTQGSHKAV